MISDNAYTISVPEVRTQDTVSALIEHLGHLESRRSKLNDEAKALEQSIVEAKQKIRRAVAVLMEALGEGTPKEAELPDPRWASS